MVAVAVIVSRAAEDVVTLAIAGVVGGISSATVMATDGTTDSIEAVIASDLHFKLLGVDVSIRCAESDLRSLIQAYWGHLSIDTADGPLTYQVGYTETESVIEISRGEQVVAQVTDTGELLHALEVDTSIAVQRICRELYFVHAAVAEVEGQACLLVAASGGGKSTTLWGMLHHGWRYMSDELAPVDLEHMQVMIYPRALGLKRRPPAYPVPIGTVETPRSFHIPVNKLPQVSQLSCCRLAAAYFLDYCPELDRPSIEPMGTAEASARLYANSLNQLAHGNAGLDAAVQIAQSIRCFSLRSTDLAATCELVAQHAKGY